MRKVKNQEAKDIKPKVTGIGGIFFKSDNPAKTREWYASNLGLATTEFGSSFEFRNANNPDYEPYTNWIDSSYAECLQNWTTNIEWGACIGKHKEMWLDFMNYEYKELLTSLDDEGKTLLKASQEAWIRNNLEQEQFWDYFFEQKPNFFGREGTFGSNMVDLQIIRKRAVEIHIYKNAFR